MATTRPSAGMAVRLRDPSGTRSKEMLGAGVASRCRPFVLALRLGRMGGAVDQRPKAGESSCTDGRSRGKAVLDAKSGRWSMAGPTLTM